MGAHTLTHVHTIYLSTFSLPEVRWQLTNPKDVPLKRKETPTAPLFPETTEILNLKTHFVLLNNVLIFLAVSHDIVNFLYFLFCVYVIRDIM